MAQFHPLTVTDIQKTIRDAVVVTLEPANTEDFTFVPGQYLTFKRDFEGEELRRSYSICAGLDDGILQVGIKKVDGGAFSTWANEDMKIGDTLCAMPPIGNFHTSLDPNAANHYLAFAGGSGITPILSILTTVLSREPLSSFTLVYANRAVSTIMFRDALEDLKNTFMGRLNVIHILEQDAQDIDLFTGRVDAQKCALLFKHWINISSVTTAFICGPEPMMLAIKGALKDHGLNDTQIKFELFAGTQSGRAKRKARVTAQGLSDDTAVKLTLDGETRSFKMPPNASVLETALQNNIDAPHACKAGVCSTCKARVLEGDFEMLTNHALEDYEVTQGYVLTCQCYALSDNLVVDYDQ